MFPKSIVALSTFVSSSNLNHFVSVMKASFASLALAVSGASAALLPRQQCCFQLTAGGALSGVVGQLSDGQNRVNESLPAATYCLSGGAITDGSGRG